MPIPINHRRKAVTHSLFPEKKASGEKKAGDRLLGDKRRKNKTFLWENKTSVLQRIYRRAINMTDVSR